MFNNTSTILHQVFETICNIFQVFNIEILKTLKFQSDQQKIKNPINISNIFNSILFQLLLASQECIKQVIKQENQTSAENITRPDQNIEYESVLIKFQNLNIDSVETGDDDGISHRSAMCTRWQSTLCKYAADIILREKIVKAKEDAASAQMTNIELWKSKSEMLDCKICFDDICNIICFPCKHFVMCFSCFNNSVITRRDSCPVCRADIHTYSRVFVT